MYPLFFIPPYNPRKRITVTGAMPKTHIFSSNAYELEILCILAMWRFDDERVKDMLAKTRNRLKTTCFGKYCNTGECFEASIATLRFLSSVFPEEKQWIDKLFNGVRNDIDNRPNGVTRSSGVYHYYFLTLSEIYSPMADDEIRRYQSRFECMFSRSATYTLKYDRIFNPIRLYIVRNCIARFPEFVNIKDSKGYEGKDGRFHFDDIPLIL